jgi:hypothetical protein
VLSFTLLYIDMNLCIITTPSKPSDKESAFPLVEVPCGYLGDSFPKDKKRDSFD